MNYDKGSNVSQNVWELEEFFVPIQGFEERYKISNEGRIISIGGMGKGRVVKDRFLKPSKNGDGYFSVILSKDGNPKQFRVHRLIALHFIPNPNNYPIINHIDGTRDNNAIDNLEWCTYSHNTKHAYNIGSKIACPLRGEKSNFAKLSEFQVLEIRRIYNEKEIGVCKIAKLFGVRHSQISRIVNRTRWAHL
jgi:hypothetical protein